MSSSGEMEDPNVVGPSVIGGGRLRRLERKIRDEKIVNGGDIEVFPAEQGTGRILRLSTWLRSQLGIRAGRESNAAEEATIGAAVLLKIHGLHPDSPATGVRMYHGDLYANGSAAALTTADVTVRIPGVAANVTTPAYGAWTDIPAGAGIFTTATWVGATTTHTNDAVYELVGLQILA